MVVFYMMKTFKWSCKEIEIKYSMFKFEKS